MKSQSVTGGLKNVCWSLEIAKSWCEDLSHTQVNISGPTKADLWKKCILFFKYAGGKARNQVILLVASSNGFLFKCLLWVKRVHISMSYLLSSYYRSLVLKESWANRVWFHLQTVDLGQMEATELLWTTTLRK